MKNSIFDTAIAITGAIATLLSTIFIAIDLNEKAIWCLLIAISMNLLRIVRYLEQKK